MKRASACPSPEQLLSFVMGKCPDDELETVSQHLDECTACEVAAVTLERTSDSFVAALQGPKRQDAFAAEAKCAEAVDRIAAFGRDPSFATQHARGGGASSPESTQLGQYQLLEKLGEGGMGAVYKALHLKLEKVVAVKVLPAEKTRNEQAVARFEREMKAVGKLDHANIVRAMDAGEHEGTHYLVMEHIRGTDLSKLVRTHGPLPVADACELVRQAAIGLQHAHEHGLVHRDIKPSNLMLAVSG